MAVEFGVGFGKSGRYGLNLAGEWPNSQGFWGVWFRLFVKSGWYGQIWQWNLEWVLANQGGVGRIWQESGPIPRVFGGVWLRLFVKLGDRRGGTICQRAKDSQTETSSPLSQEHRSARAMVPHLGTRVEIAGWLLTCGVANADQDGCASVVVRKGVGLHESQAKQET